MNAIIPSRRRTGFTLVEVLVVTGILAILFALATGVAIKALASAEDARAAAEIRQLQVGIEAFKSKFGVAYIPSQITLRTRLGDYANNDPDWQYLTTLWPRLAKIKTDNSNPSAPRQYPGFVDWAQEQIPITTGSPPPDNYGYTGVRTYTLQGHQCLAFFLGGYRYDNSNVELGGYTGFSTRPDNPMLPDNSQSPTRSGPYYEIKAERLTTKVRKQYMDQRDFAALKDSYETGAPYYYFSGYRTGYKQEAVIPTGPAYGPTNMPPVGFTLRPYRDYNNGQFYNPNGFQLICAGRDGKVGSFSFTNTNNQFVEWKNGAYSNNVTLPLAPNNTDFMDDICNFHPVKISIPQ